MILIWASSPQNFVGRTVTYGLGQLETLVPAYGATIHKSQGAAAADLCAYTGATRGKPLVVLVGEKKAGT